MEQKNKRYAIRVDDRNSLKVKTVATAGDRFDKTVARTQAHHCGPGRDEQHEKRVEKSCLHQTNERDLIRASRIEMGFETEYQPALGLLLRNERNLLLS